MRFIILATIFATAIGTIMAAPVGVSKLQETSSLASAQTVNESDRSIIPAPCTGSQCQDSHSVHLARRGMTKEEKQRAEASRQTALEDSSHQEKLRDELNAHGERHAGDAVEEGIDEQTRKHRERSAQEYYEQADKHNHLHLASKKDAEALEHRINGDEAKATVAEGLAKHHREMAAGPRKSH
ncbi:hypothetical protein FRB91_010186 [Serendipita sp. 411]|nr:hypothetical protein FRB91_010186 [Serendipita sp. 411]